jgi:3-oxoacyl-ACP reductase-like protein
MPDNVDKIVTHTRARILLSLAIGACLALLASDCSKSHVQETVTVAPRAAATPPVITAANSSSAPPTVDAETEAAGDALSHAMVALKARRRDEALRYMNFARIRLTHLINRTDMNANSNSTRERLISDLRELDAAERAARHNEYEQSRAQLISITNELDRLTEGLSPRQN